MRPDLAVLGGWVFLSVMCVLCRGWGFPPVLGAVLFVLMWAIMVVALLRVVFFRPPPRAGQYRPQRPPNRGGG